MEVLIQGVRADEHDWKSRRTAKINCGNEADGPTQYANLTTTQRKKRARCIVRLHRDQKTEEEKDEASAAERIEVDGWGGRRGDGEIAGAEGVLEGGRAGGESGIGVQAVEGVAFGLREGDEIEAAGTIEVEEFWEHFGVQGADVHEKDVGNIAMVKSLGKLAVIRDVGVGGREVAGL